MTFESLAIAGLSIGLSMEYILDFEIGLTIGLLNEKNNQILEMKIRNKKNEEEVVVGDANMLMKM